MAHGGVVLIVVSSRVLVEHWVDRLRDAGVEWVTEFRSAKEAIVALDEAEGDPVANRGAIVATIQLLTHGAGRRAAGSLSLSLLIVERYLPLNAIGAGRSTSAAVVTELAARSQRVIVVARTGVDLPWSEPTETLNVSLIEALELRPANVPFVVATYAVAPNELALYERAQDLAVEAGEVSFRASTRPSLHGMLTQMAARLSGEPSRTEEPEDVSDNEPAARPDSSKTCGRCSIKSRHWRVTRVFASSFSWYKRQRTRVAQFLS